MPNSSDIRVGLSPVSWNQPLKLKLFAVVGFLIATIAAFIFVYVPHQLEAQATRSLHDKAASIAQMTAFSISAALYFDDTEVGQEVLLGAGLNRELLSIVALDRNGSVFASHRPLSEGRDRAFSDDPEESYTLKTPIQLYGETLGSLRTTFSMFELREEVHRARVTVAAVSLLVFLIGSLVVFGLSSVITAPLRDMLQAVGHIDRGDWSQRVEVRSSDEMGMLAKSFNDMVTSVQNRTKDLEQEISERQRFEAALLESEAAKQAILDAIPDLMFRVDRHGRFLDARGAEEQLLLQPEQIIGHNVTDLLPLRIALRIMTNITDCLASRRAVSFEYGLMLEGRRRYFEARMIPENEFEIFAIVRDTRTPRRRSGPAGMPNGPCRNSGPSVCAQIACARLVRWPPGSPMNSTNRLPGSAGWRNTP